MAGLPQQRPRSGEVLLPFRATQTLLGILSLVLGPALKTSLSKGEQAQRSRSRRDEGFGDEPVTGCSGNVMRFGKRRRGADATSSQRSAVTELQGLPAAFPALSGAGLTGFHEVAAERSPGPQLLAPRAWLASAQCLCTASP